MGHIYWIISTVLLTQIFSVINIVHGAKIPPCAADSMWMPLSEIETGSSDASLSHQHICIHTAGVAGLSWSQSAGACNSYQGFLLYAFNTSHVEMIAKKHAADLGDLSAQPKAKRTVFISLHDSVEEGIPSYDMRWLHYVQERFSISVNQTHPNSPFSQLILRGKFADGVHMWNPNAQGKLEDELMGGESNTEDNDCAAMVIQADSSLKYEWIDCQQTKAAQVICMRETSASDAEGAEPCSLYYTYDELTINTDILGVASIQGGSSSLKNKFHYAESVENAKQRWLFTDSDAGKFMLPSLNSMYFSVLCKPGWFPTDLINYPVTSISCAKIRKNIMAGSTQRRYENLCPFYEGCQYPFGEKSFDKGTHIEICNSQGYCQPEKLNNTYGRTECVCQLGFTGDNCDRVDYDPCNDPNNPNRCGEGQKCIPQQHDYYCECHGRLSVSKHDCRFDVNDCINNPCKNNATCVDMVGSLRCDCRRLVDVSTWKFVRYDNGSDAYWKGDHCDIDPINSCDPNPCHGRPGVDYIKLYGQTSKGTCKDLINGFSCACDYPWSGIICEDFDKHQLVQAITGNKKALIYFYLALCVIFNFSCMLLTIIRRREIATGVYKTDDMIIARYEAERKKEREMLMQFVEDAAYSSEENDGKSTTHSKRLRRKKTKKDQGSTTAAKYIVNDKTSGLRPQYQDAYVAQQSNNSFHLAVAREPTKTGFHPLVPHQSAASEDVKSLNPSVKSGGGRARSPKSKRRADVRRRHGGASPGKAVSSGFRTP